MQKIEWKCKVSWNRKKLTGTQWHFFTVFFPIFVHSYICIFNPKYPCQYFTKFVESWFFLKRRRSSIEPTWKIYFIVSWRFSRKLRWKWNYFWYKLFLIAKWIIRKEGCYAENIGKCCLSINNLIFAIYFWVTELNECRKWNEKAR